MPTTLLPFVGEGERCDDEVCKGIAKSLASYMNTFNLTTLSRRATKRSFLFVSQREGVGEFVPKEIRISEDEKESQVENENNNEKEVESNANQPQTQPPTPTPTLTPTPTPTLTPTLTPTPTPTLTPTPNESSNLTLHSKPTNHQRAVEEEPAAPLLLYRRFSSRGIQRVGDWVFCST